MKLVAIGDNCVDYYPATDKSFPGGNAVNVAVYYRRMGGEAAYIGAVGNDKFGKMMLERLSDKGVDVSRVHVEDGKTAVTYIDLVNGDRVFGDYIEGVMEDFRLNESDFAYIKDFELCFGAIWGHVDADMQRVKEKGLVTAFDYSDQLNDPMIASSCPYVDYAFFSEDEKDDEWIKDYMRDIHQRGTKVVIVTRGSNGSMAYDGEQFYHQGIVSCPVVDTIGAGDSYIAGFLYGIGTGKSVPEAMAMGANNSAITIQYDGAW